MSKNKMIKELVKDFSENEGKENRQSQVRLRMILELLDESDLELLMQGERNG